MSRILSTTTTNNSGSGCPSSPEILRNSASMSAPRRRFGLSFPICIPHSCGIAEYAGPFLRQNCTINIERCLVLLFAHDYVLGLSSEAVFCACAAGGRDRCGVQEAHCEVWQACGDVHRIHLGRWIGARG